MSGSGKAGKDDGKKTISILLVDDIAEAREGIKKLLAFEQDFKVVGTAANGRDGVQQAKELKPDIVIMDINMPDMDGLEAAGLITRAMPMVGVIMMSVQDDADYIQKAMLAGARFFLTKPPDMDKLYTTIRNVYAQYEPLRLQFKALSEGLIRPIEVEKEEGAGDRPGHIIVVYSPTGGSGCTTVATNLASGLMKEGIKTLLIDGDLQFGDVGAFLDLRSQQTMVELIENLDDLDLDYFESIVMTHNSGMKVVLGPPRPAIGAEIRDTRPDAVTEIINKIGSHYDFIIVDSSHTIDAAVASLLDAATRIVLLINPTLPSIKNARLVLDMLDQNGFAPDKTTLVVNKAVDPKTAKGVPTPDKIQTYLRRPVEGIIPAVDERIILGAINRGIPVIASDRDTTKAPIKQMLDLSNHLFKQLMGEEDAVVEQPTGKTSSFSFFGRGGDKRK
jgi:pilus assembly protein CpaE